MEWIARRARVCAWCAFPDLVRHTIYIRLNILTKNLSLAKSSMAMRMLSCILRGAGNRCRQPTAGCSLFACDMMIMFTLSFYYCYAVVWLRPLVSRYRASWIRQHIDDLFIFLTFGSVAISIVVAVIAAVQINWFSFVVGAKNQIGLGERHWTHWTRSTETFGTVFRRLFVNQFAKRFSYFSQIAAVHGTRFRDEDLDLFHISKWMCRSHTRACTRSIWD